MKLKKPILIAITLLLCAGFLPQTAKGQTRTSPEALVANLYKQHKKRSPFFQTKSRAVLDRYFDKHLADLILQDAVRSKGEVGALDGDPLFNAQDMEITKFLIHKAVYREGQAEVLVSFENFGQKKEITFLLETRRSGWKITNIKYDDGADLLGILQSESAAARSTREVKVYLVALGDNGAHGKKIGCDDSLVPVTRTIATTKALLRATLQQLLSLQAESADYPGLHNLWKGRNLTLRSVSIQRGIATIHFAGGTFITGVCDEPRILEQIEATALQFPNVKDLRVFIGKQTLEQAIH